MEKIERGVMVMKYGKAWGIEYEDGHCTSYGWIDPCDAPIRNPEYVKSPSDITYRNSPYIKELMTGKIVHVERRTVVTIVKEGVE